MKLTCVTATFNCIKAGNRERLIRCVESVAKLKTEHEHLIYDGASTDGTADLLRELEAKTPGLKVVSEPDTGIYNALNKGVRDAKGEWFYVLGADDYICNVDVLDRLLLEYEADVIVTPVSKDNGVRAVRIECIYSGVPYCHQGMVARTEILRCYTGGFDERFKICADYDQMLKLHDKACRIRYSGDIFAHFGAGGISSSFQGQLLDDVISVIVSHFNVGREVAWEMHQKMLLPFHLVFRYLWHKDVALRNAARSSFKARCRQMVRAILFVNH